MTVRLAEQELTGVRRWLDEAYGQRRRAATAAALLVTLAVAYHVVFGQNGLTAYQKKKDDAQSLTRQLDAMRQENEALKGHVERLDHDPGAIEHQAREALHYTRPGEVIVTLQPELSTEKK